MIPIAITESIVMNCGKFVYSLVKSFAIHHRRDLRGTASPLRTAGSTSIVTRDSTPATNDHALPRDILKILQSAGTQANAGTTITAMKYSRSVFQERQPLGPSRIENPANLRFVILMEVAEQV